MIPPDVGGGTWEPDEDEYPDLHSRRIADFDVGVAREAAVVVDLTPVKDRKNPAILPQVVPPVVSPPARVAWERSVAGAETGKATEAARVLDLTPALEDEQDFEDLLLSGALDMLLA